MLFTEEDKTFIKFLHLIMGYGLRKLMTESPDKELKGLLQCYIG